MSPLQLEILLHYYACANDFRDGDFTAPAVSEAIEDFRCKDGLLCAGGDGNHGPTYQLTPRGRVFVDALCALPLPEQVWVMPAQAKEPTQ